MNILLKRAAHCAAAISMSFGLAGGASAATLDFTTATYASTFGPNVATDLVDGVNFTVTATARGADGFRQGGGGGLSFGVPGNGMYSLSIVADQDLTFNSMFGKGHGFPTRAGQMPFDMDVAGTEVSGDNMFVSAPHFSTAYETVSFAGGPISVTAGQTFFFHADFGALVGSSIYASALVRSLDFSTVAGPSPIPLPAGLPLLIGGIAFLGLVRQKRQKRPA